MSVTEEDKDLLDALEESFKKYYWFFQVPVHGTRQQLHAMIALGLKEYIAKALAAERKAVLESPGVMGMREALDQIWKSEANEDGSIDTDIWGIADKARKSFDKFVEEAGE